MCEQTTVRVNIIGVSFWYAFYKSYISHSHSTQYIIGFQKGIGFWRARYGVRDDNVESLSLSWLFGAYVMSVTRHSLDSGQMYVHDIAYHHEAVTDLKLRHLDLVGNTIHSLATGFNFWLITSILIDMLPSLVKNLFACQGQEENDRCEFIQMLHTGKKEMQSAAEMTYFCYLWCLCRYGLAVVWVYHSSTSAPAVVCKYEGVQFAVSHDMMCLNILFFLWWTKLSKKWVSIQYTHIYMYVCT